MIRDISEIELPKLNQLLKCVFKLYDETDDAKILTPNQKLKFEV